MKILSKFNRGAIVFTVIVLLVIAYLVITAINQSADIPKIKEICTNYLSTEGLYKMLPKKFRVKKPAITESEKDQYIADMQKDLAAYYSENDQSYQFLINGMKKAIDTQAKGKGVIFEFKKTIIRFSVITFDGDTATAVMEVKNKYKGPNFLHENKSYLNEFTNEDTVMLNKINGSWKVIYSNLSPGGDGITYNSQINYEEER